MAIPFSTQPNTVATNRLNTSRAHFYFVPHGVNPDTGVAFCGANSTSSVPKGIGLVCSTQKIANVKIEPTTNEEVKSFGKTNYTYTTGGKLSLSVELESGDVNTLLILQGKDVSSATANAYIPRQIPHQSGDLFVQYWNQSDLRKSVYIPNCQVRITDIAMGDGPDAAVMQMLEFFKDGDAEVYETRGNISFAVEMWELISGGAGTGVPAAAPDGVIDDFILGTSNMAGVNGTTSPVALKIDDEFIAAKYGSGATNLDKYFIRVSVDGTVQTNSQVTYTTGTRTLTFTTAPLINTAVMAVYICNYATALPPNWTTGPSTIVEAMKYGWGEYA